MPTYLVRSTLNFVIPNTANHPQVTAKKDASPEQVEAYVYCWLQASRFPANTLDTSSTKQHARDQGGEIQHEYSLIKGFS